MPLAIFTVRVETYVYHSVATSLLTPGSDGKQPGQLLTDAPVELSSIKRPLLVP